MSYHDFWFITRRLTAVNIRSSCDSVTVNVGLTNQNWSYFSSNPPDSFNKNSILTHVAHRSCWSVSLFIYNFGVLTYWFILPDRTGLDRTVPDWTCGTVSWDDPGGCESKDPVVWFLPVLLLCSKFHFNVMINRVMWRWVVLLYVDIHHHIYTWNNKCSGSGYMVNKTDLTSSLSWWDQICEKQISPRLL